MPYQTACINAKLFTVCLARIGSKRRRSGGWRWWWRASRWHSIFMEECRVSEERVVYLYIYEYTTNILLTARVASVNDGHFDASCTFWNDAPLVVSPAHLCIKTCVFCYICIARTQKCCSIWNKTFITLFRALARLALLANTFVHINKYIRNIQHSHRTSNILNQGSSTRIRICRVMGVADSAPSHQAHVYEYIWCRL